MAPISPLTVLSHLNPATSGCAPASEPGVRLPHPKETAMPFIGGDTEQMRQYSELATRKSTLLAEMGSHLDAVVLNEQMWVGHDADEFRTRYQTDIRPRLDQVSADVQGCGITVTDHAEEQDAASGADSGTGTDNGSTGNGNGGGGLPEWLTNPTKTWSDFQKLWNKGKKLFDVSRAVPSWMRGLTDPDAMKQIGHLLDANLLAQSKVFNWGKEFSKLTEKVLGNFNIPTGFFNRQAFGFIDDFAQGFAGKASHFLSNPAFRLAGKAAPWLDVGLGGFEAYEGFRDGDRQKQVTGGMTAVGGGMVLAGAAASATGVGAVAGVPLMVGGTALSLGAAGLDIAKDYFGWSGF